MRKGIGFKGTIREFQALVRPELNRCGMLGLRIAADAPKIQTRINRAATQPRKVA